MSANSKISLTGFWTLRFPMHVRLCLFHKILVQSIKLGQGYFHARHFYRFSPHCNFVESVIEFFTRVAPNAVSSFKLIIFGWHCNLHKRIIMTECPSIFSASIIRELLDSTKTHIRHMVKLYGGKVWMISFWRVETCAV